MISARMLKRQLLKIDVSGRLRKVGTAATQHGEPHQFTANSTYRGRHNVSLSQNKLNRFESPIRSKRPFSESKRINNSGSNVEIPEASDFDKSPRVAVSSTRAKKSQILVSKHKLKIKEQSSKDGTTQTSRIILIDWLTQVSIELEISKDALQTAIFYLDKMNSRHSISKNNYQYLGLSCLLLSHKLDSRKAISLETASALVEGSLSAEGFASYEVQVLQCLKFKLHPFTLWQQMNMIVAGFELALHASTAVSCAWKSVKDKAIWIAEGMKMQLPFAKIANCQTDLCLKIIEALLVKQKDEALRARFSQFCRKWLQHAEALPLGNLRKGIGFWVEARCVCADEYGRDSYHPELKLIANKCMVLI